MKYNHKNVPLNTPVYATAYLMDDEDLTAYLKCKPILGEVIDIERYKKEVGDNPPRFLRGLTEKYYIDGKWEERYRQKPKNILWQRFNDGWFDYWVCSLCGRRSWTKEPQCPDCKSHMINGDKKH